MKRLILAAIAAVAVLATGAPSPATPGGPTGTSPSGALTITIDQPSPHTLVSTDAPVQVSGTIAPGPFPINLFYVIDVSQGTGLGGGTCGDPNGDGPTDTILECEIAGLIALNSANLGLDADVTLVSFDSTATGVDVSPAPGVQSSTGPAVDADGNGAPDVVDALLSLRPVERPADFERALGAVHSLVVENNESNSVFFVSGGQSEPGVGPFTGPGSALQALIDEGVTVSSFAVNPTTGGCATGEPLQIIAIGGGTCHEITDPEQMGMIITPPPVGNPRPGRVEVEVNGHVTYATLERSGRFSAVLPADLLRPGRNDIVARDYGPDGSHDEFAEATTFVVVKGPRR